MSTTPKIYVADLEAYNAGKLKGVWVDLQDHSDIDSVWEFLNQSLNNPEEVAIHDYEGFDGLEINEYDSIEKLMELIELHEEIGELLFPICAYLGTQNIADIKEMYSRYVGIYTDVEEYVHQFLDELGILDKRGVLHVDIVERYFDYEKYARDLQYGGDIIVLDLDSEVAVFSSY